MGFKNVTVLGGGVLGSMIAYQAAYCGFNVTVWLRSEGSIGRTQPKLDNIHKTYIDLINVMDAPEGKNPAIWADGIGNPETFDKDTCLANADAAYKNVKLELDLAEAVKDADLVIESVAEDVQQKLDMYTQLAPVLPEKTVLVTNSSSFPGSIFADATGRPEKFLSLHFANNIWKLNLAEIMAHGKTDMKYFDQIIEFAKEIKMVPCPVKKEKAGYAANSLLIPFLTAAMDLYVKDIVDPADADKAWKIGTGAAYGPFEFLDIIGMETPYNIFCGFAAHPEMVEPYDFQAIADAFKKKIDEGKLGLAAGEGFYKYN